MYKRFCLIFLLVVKMITFLVSIQSNSLNYRGNNPTLNYILVIFLAIRTTLKLVVENENLYNIPYNLLSIEICGKCSLNNVAS